MTARGDGAIEAAPPAAAAWTVLALLMILGMVAFLDRQVMSLLVAPIKRDLVISDTQVGLLQGFAFALLYATAALPIGQAVDRHSRRLIIFAGVFVWGAAASLSGLATTFGGLLTARIFVGLGEAALAPASYSILSDLFARTRLALALSVYSIGSTLGSALALVATAALFVKLGDGVALPMLGHLRPWQAVLFVTGLPGLMLSFLVFVMPEPRRTASDVSDGHGAAGWHTAIAFLAAHRRFFGCHFIAFSCLTASAYAALSWIPSVLQRRFGWSIAEVGVVLGGLSGAAGIVGLLANGAITDRLFARGDGGAHLRYYLYGAIMIGVLGLSASYAPSAALYLGMMTPFDAQQFRRRGGGGGADRHARAAAGTNVGAVPDDGEPVRHGDGPLGRRLDLRSYRRADATSSGARPYLRSAHAGRRHVLRDWCSRPAPRRRLCGPSKWRGDVGRRPAEG